ncbi:MAG: branched-chain amino acid ABC transporter permease [Acidimicrobiia bacterium]|nr:branched-chain amino acid ABC transporter permease [Actinomycetota bacterium]MBL6924595.1 branched-chain amino acid ABC transporter permease [Acidimicrobiia bacterium]
METLVAVLVSTLSLAAGYGLLAIGISLTWSSLGLLNLAHGITFGFAGYGAWWFGTEVSANPVGVVIAGVVTGAFTGLVVVAVAFLPIKRQENFPVRSLTITLALNLVGTQILLRVFGPKAKNIPSVFTFDSINLFGTVILPDRTGMIVTAAVVLLATLIWFRRSRSGLRVRALMQNPEGAALVGVSLNRTAVVVMMVSGALAGLSAVLLQEIFFASPYSWSTPLIKGLVIALLGGLGSIPGALLAALVLGATEAGTARFVGGQYVLYTQFALVVGVLLARPRGIGGLLDEVREADE